MATFVNNSSDDNSKVEIRAVKITDIPARIAKKLLLEEEKKAKYDESGKAHFEVAKNIFNQNQNNSVSKLREAFSWLKKSVDANCYDAHLYILGKLNALKILPKLKVDDFIKLKIAYEYQFAEAIEFVNYYTQNRSVNPTISLGIYLFVYQGYSDNINHAMDIINMTICKENLGTQKYKTMKELLVEIFNNPECFEDYNYFIAILELTDNYFTNKHFAIGVQYLNLAIEQDFNIKAYRYMLNLFSNAINGSIDASITIGVLIKSKNKFIKCDEALADDLFKYAYNRLKSLKDIDVNNQKNLAYLCEGGIGGKQNLKLARELYYKLSQYQRLYNVKYKQIDDAIAIRRKNMVIKTIEILLVLFIVILILYLFMD